MLESEPVVLTYWVLTVGKLDIAEAAEAPLLWDAVTGGASVAAVIANAMA